MNLGIVFADHVNHLCVDDEDDHHILITKCGLRVGYTPPKNRQASPFGDHVTCLACMTLDENVDPDASPVPSCGHAFPAPGCRWCEYASARWRRRR
jgi:hypothetical protein